MRVSELAKEMGYKAAELVEVAKIKGVKIENARATVNARMAMQVRAHIPHRSKLSGDMLEQYKKIQETIVEFHSRGQNILPYRIQFLLKFLLVLVG